MFSQPRTLPLIVAVLPSDDIRVRIARDILLIVGFSLLVALLARVSVHTPFSPVPITGQTLGVLLAGATLGSWRGAAALGLYLVEGTHFSVYSGSSGDYIWQATSSSYIFGFTSGSSGLFWELASGGYIIGFIPAAWLVGYLCEHGWDRKVWIILAMFAGNAVLYVPGLIQLSLFAPDGKLLDWGLYPFVAGDLIKLYVAALTVPLAWQLLNLRKRDNRWT